MNTKEKTSPEKAIDQTTVENGLKELGLKKGSVVEVHSSLSSFGKVDGGASTIVNALMNIVGNNGSLAMSAYPVSPPIPLSDEDVARGIKWKVKIYPEDTKEKSSMGSIVQNFLERPDVKLGRGVHKVAAWGKDAEDISDQGYKKLLKLDGWVLLMGVGIDRCSSMHIAEDEVPIPDDISKLTQIPEDINKDYDPKHWGIGYGGTPDDAWSKVYKKADQLGLIKHVQIGNSHCQLFKAKPVIELFKQWRRTNPYDLYGVKINDR